MKKAINILLALFFLSVSSKGDDAVKSVNNSTIKNVKIFLSGAQVNRNTKVNVGAGQSVLAIEGLSSAIDASSISVTGTGNAMIMGVSFRLDYLKDIAKTPEMKLLQDSLDLLKSAIDKVNMME